MKTRKIIKRKNRKTKNRKTKNNFKIRGGSSRKRNMNALYGEQLYVNADIDMSHITDTRQLLQLYKNKTNELEGYRSRKIQVGYDTVLEYLSNISSALTFFRKPSILLDKEEEVYFKENRDKILSSIEELKMMATDLFFKETLNASVSEYFVKPPPEDLKVLPDSIKKALFVIGVIEIDFDYRRLIPDTTRLIKKRVVDNSITFAPTQFYSLSDNINSFVEFTGTVNAKLRKSIVENLKKPQYGIFLECINESISNITDNEPIKAENIAFIPRLDSITGIETNNNVDLFIAVALCGLSDTVTRESEYYYLQSDSLTPTGIPGKNKFNGHQHGIPSDFKNWQIYVCVGTLSKENIRMRDANFIIRTKGRNSKVYTQSDLTAFFDDYCTQNRTTRAEMLGRLQESFKNTTNKLKQKYPRVNHRDILRNMFIHMNECLLFTYEESCGAHGGGDLNAAALAKPAVTLGINSDYRLPETSLTNPYFDGVMADVVGIVGPIFKGIPGTFNVGESSSLNTKTARSSFSQKVNLFSEIMDEDTILAQMSGRHFMLDDLEDSKKALKDYLNSFLDILLKNICKTSVNKMFGSPNLECMRVGGSGYTKLIDYTTQALLKLLIPNTTFDNIANISRAGCNGNLLDNEIKHLISRDAKKVFDTLVMTPVEKRRVFEILVESKFINKRTSIAILDGYASTNDDSNNDDSNIEHSNNDDSNIEHSNNEHSDSSKRTKKKQKVNKKVKFIPTVFVDKFLDYYYDRYLPLRIKEKDIERMGEFASKPDKDSKIYRELCDIASKTAMLTGDKSSIDGPAEIKMASVQLSSYIMSKVSFLPENFLKEDFKRVFEKYMNGFSEKTQQEFEEVLRIKDISGYNIAMSPMRAAAAEEE